MQSSQTAIFRENACQSLGRSVFWHETIPVNSLPISAQYARKQRKFLLFLLFCACSNKQRQSRSLCNICLFSQVWTSSKHKLTGIADACLGLHIICWIDRRRVHALRPTLKDGACRLRCLNLVHQTQIGCLVD